MSKQSALTNLLVMPLIASAVFLASPALASNGLSSFHKGAKSSMSVGNHAPGGHKGIAGTVVSISGSIITVTGVDKLNYTVDASKAVIMKGGTETNANPSIVTIADIHVGDTVFVRGVIVNETQITAERVFDGQFEVRHGKMKKMHRHLKHS